VARRVTAERPPAPARDPALSVRGISKHFTGTVALADVSVTVYPGTVHALIGENGSGKSTLIKILAGVQVADAGTVAAHGEGHAAEHFGAVAARAAGLRFVHQDLGLFDDMSVSENFALQIGYPRDTFRRIRWKALNARTRATLRRFQLTVEPNTRVGRLAAADRTLVAVARALHDSHDGKRVLILDEPTASLPEREAERLLSGLRRAADEGQAILLVSHKLQEVLAVADQITVLRDGKVVAELDVAECDERRLIELIAGSAVEEVPAAATAEHSAGEVLRVKRLWSGALRGVGMSCMGGEIVGVLGLLGSGRSRLLRCIAGDAHVDRGSVWVAGRPLRPGSTVRAAAAGVAFVAEDRSQTVFRDWLVRYNASISTLDRYWRHGVLHRSEEAAAVGQAIRRYGVRTPSDAVPVSQLSGGNQQKLVLARTLEAAPKVLLLDEPTAGVDVVARAQIHSILREAAADGAGIVIVSSDTAELAQLCSRIVVLAGGEIVDELRGELDTGRLVDALHTARPAGPG
jgi:ribose transport system ATP-binding protein